MVNKYRTLIGCVFLLFWVTACGNFKSDSSSKSSNIKIQAAELNQGMVFNLIDSQTNEIVKSFQGEVVELAVGNLQKFNVTTNFTDGKVDSVKFIFSSGYSRTERSAPYAACGDVDGSFRDCRRYLKGESVKLSIRAFNSSGKVVNTGEIMLLLNKNY